MSTATQQPEVTTSQTQVLAQLDRLRAAIEALPPDAQVDWLGGTSCIWLDYDQFREYFRGRTVTVEEPSGNMFIRVNGVNFGAICSDKTAPQTHEVTL